MHRSRHAPGDWVGQEQREKRAVQREYRVNPKNPKAAGADDCYHHRQQGFPHRAQDAGECIHQPAKKISGAYHGKAQGARFDYGGIRRIETQERIVQQINAVAEHQPEEGRKQQAGAADLADPFIPACTDVLACKGKRSLCN